MGDFNLENFAQKSINSLDKTTEAGFAEALLIAIGSLKDRHGKFIRVRLSDDREDEHYFCNQIAEMMLNKEKNNG